MSLTTRVAEPEVSEVTTRPVRVLHIGNIANNAFYNSVLLRRLGYESFVLQYDYYHAVSLPEWELCDFDAAKLGDLFYPDWQRAGIDPSARPKWHIVGPLRLAVSYLEALVGEDHRAAGTLKTKIDRAYRLRLLRHEIELKRPQLSKEITKRNRQLRSAPYQAVRTARIVRAAPLRMARRIPTRRIRVLAFRAKRKSRHLAHKFRSPEQLSSYAARLSRFKKLFSPIALLSAPLSVPIVLSNRVMVKRRIRADEQLKANSEFERSAQRIIQQFSEEFPDREPMEFNDILPYRDLLPMYRQLFGKFDVVICYSTDPIIPFLAGVPYMALEHGTLREIPYWTNGVGRLTSLAYRHADHVFITNEDCEASAQKLGVTNYSVMPHPYDNDRQVDEVAMRQASRDLQSRTKAKFVFLAAARHDWVPLTGYADKGNDKWIRAVAHLRATGYDVGVVTVEMGANVQESKDLIDSLGISDHVIWESFLSLKRLELWSRAGVGVLDQFHLGTGVGGVAFKTMAVGATVLAHIDQQLMAGTYGEDIPIVTCSTTEEIASQMKRVIDDRVWADQVGKQAAEWIDRHYGWKKTSSIVDTAIRQTLKVRSTHE
jgi:glycosyltransferase involved in cell wall biosynthesis